MQKNDEMFGIVGSVPQLSKDKIAEMLHANPELIDSFEKSYSKHVLSKVDDNFFAVNSRQAAEQKHLIDTKEIAETRSINNTDIGELEQRIVNELLEKTTTYKYDGNHGETLELRALSDGATPIQKSEMLALPESLRPQLTGELMKIEIEKPSFPALLFYYDRYINGKTEEERKDAYNHFRQGLDILDLDNVTYEIISTNPNSMGYWFPKLVDACIGQKFFKIPSTVIAKVPLTMLQLTRLDYMNLTPITLKIVDKWAYRAFALDDSKEYFVKTGTYSSKFDFRNCYVHGEKEVRELGEYLLYIHYQALRMASPLCTPCIYGASTTTEWVVREFIPDKENNPCIYKGMPLHTEYRVFVDCDRDLILGIVPYWEPNTMKSRFSEENDSSSPHQIHDYIVYKSHEDTLMRRYNENKDIVMKEIQNILPAINLKGQWSIDIMQNGNDFWLIDMALAQNSAFYDCVPKKLRNPSVENWLPEKIS